MVHECPAPAPLQAPTATHTHRFWVTSKEMPAMVMKSEFCGPCSG